MRRILILILFVVPLYSYGQQDTISKDTLKSETVEEEMPQFPGGENGVLKFIKDNLTYPRDANWQEIQGTVRISFRVDTMGKVSNVKVLKGVHPSLDSAVVRTVKMMPPWKPGTINGRKVAVEYKLPVDFTLRDGSTSDFHEGVIAFKDEKYERAIKYFTKSIKADRKVIDSYHNRGLCYHQLGNNEEACKDWNKAKELGDKKVDAALEKYCK